MGTRERPLHRARRLSASTALSLGNEFRLARRAANLSQQAVGDLAGMSRTKVGRIEVGNTSTTLDDLWALAVPLGLDVSTRLFPVGDPARDKGQRAVLERLHVKVHEALRWRTEVPFPNAGDLRAWDAVIWGAGWSCAVEAETRLTDLQALDRKLGIKLRDGLVDHLILLVSDTRHNREVLRAGRDVLVGRFPVDGAELLEALREGRDPAGNGIVVL